MEKIFVFDVNKMNEVEGKVNPLLEKGYNIIGSEVINASYVMTLCKPERPQVNRKGNGRGRS